MHPPTDSDQYDPDWEAFRYVAGELTPSEVEAFETRLDEDQLLRSAVARAVELTQALSAVSATDTRRSDPELSIRSPRTLPFGWLAVGAAACLALIVAMATSSRDWRLSRHALHREDARPFDSAPDRELAVAWNEARNLRIESLDADAVGDRSAGAFWEELDNVLESSDGAPRSAPSWMLAAFEAFDADEASGDESPGVGEQRD